MEIECFRTFINDLKKYQKLNNQFEIEDILQHEYLNSKTFKEFELEFRAKPQIKKGISQKHIITKNCH